MLKIEVSINTYHKRIKPEGEKGFGKSETVPNQAMSIREILSRFAKGQDITGIRKSEDLEEDYTDFEKMDKFERMDYAREHKEYIKELQQEMQKQPPTNKQKEETEQQSGDVEDVT